MVSDIPIYTQLCHQIIKGIAIKELKEGDELPSVRNLAKDLGVNLHTINKAYTIMKQEGFLVVNRRKGVVVNAPDGYKSDDKYKTILKKELEVLVIEALARGLEYGNIDDLLKSIITDVKGDK